MGNIKYSATRFEDGLQKLSQLDKSEFLDKTLRSFGLGIGDGEYIYIHNAVTKVMSSLTNAQLFIMVYDLVQGGYHE